MSRQLAVVSATSGPARGTKSHRPRRVVLIGPIQQENLALQYLAAAAVEAGHQAEVVAYSYRRDLDATLRETLERAPDLVGLGIAFQNNIDDYLVLMRGLRQHGYRGHLTAGGHVPTFCYEELLRDLPELDTVVRHDGEQTLVEMLDCLADGRPVRDIAGLVWREGEGVQRGPVRRPVSDLDSIAVPRRSPRVYSVGGIVVDFLITARGCVGECNYCSIAAYTTEQKKRYRLRKPEAVVEEMVPIYAHRAARVFFLQDDLFVLPSEKKTIERTERFRAGMAAHAMNDVVFWAKGRPETVSENVCRALRKMGVIHLFLGVENASAERLGYLGRTHAPSDNEHAIANCRKAGIVPSFNFMLFDPDCSLADIDATLDLAEANLDLPWNVCRTEVYSGTALRERLQEEGRLEGDYRSYGYLMRDERAEVLFRILRVSLHERALAIGSLLNRLISLSFARQLHVHYFPGRTSEELSERAHRLGVEARADTVAVIREALEFVRTHDVHDATAVRRFATGQALRVNHADHRRRCQTEELWQLFNLRGEQLMARRGVVPPVAAENDYGVAAGS